jgi:hypothetical protein
MMRSLGLFFLAVVLFLAVGLGGLHAHSQRQVAALRGQPAFATPEQGALQMAALHYSGLRHVQIAHAGYEPCFLSNLYFVQARVLAERRSDGKALGPGGDNPGWFFLRGGEGWVFCPESSRPWLVALGQQLFGAE